MSNDLKGNYGEGVIFDHSDYAGFSLRLLILIIDSMFVFLALFLGYEVDSWLYDNYYSDNSYVLYVSLLISYIYLTSIKASKLGTFGQILTKTKVVTIYGKKAGQLQMTMRLLFWLVGPINVLIDLVFLTLIKEKRTIRDCYCDTLVIERSAIPVSDIAPVKVTRVFALGLNLMYRSCYRENSTTRMQSDWPTASR